MTSAYALAGSFIITVALLAPTRKALARYHILDIPNQRSSHDSATIRGGGIGVILGLATTTAAGPLFGVKFGVIGTSTTLAVVFLGTLGFVEDARGLSIATRLIGQGTLTTILAAAVLATIGRPMWLAPVLGAAAVFIINAANFMDGVNGISSFHGIIAGANATIVGLLSGQTDLVVSGTLITGCFAGFIPWNLPQAKMFLGDVGSYALGAAQWALGLHVWLVTGSLVLAIAPVAVYMCDVLTTLVRRAIRGDDLTSAHREHTYQRIREALDSHVLASGYAAAFTLIAAFGAIAMWRIGTDNIIAWAAIVGSCAGYHLVAGLILRNSGIRGGVSS